MCSGEMGQRTSVEFGTEYRPCSQGGSGWHEILRKSEAS